MSTNVQKGNSIFLHNVFMNDPCYRSSHFVFVLYLVVLLWLQYKYSIQTSKSYFSIFLLQKKYNSLFCWQCHYQVKRKPSTKYFSLLFLAVKYLFCTRHEYSMVKKQIKQATRQRQTAGEKCTLLYLYTKPPLNQLANQISTRHVIVIISA